MEAASSEEGKERYKAETEKIRKKLAEMEQKTASGWTKKRREVLASDIKTAKAAFNQATRASLEATSSDGDKERYKTKAGKERKGLVEMEQKTASGKAKKKREDLASDMKTAKTALNQATRAPLEATSLEEDKERYKAGAEKNLLRFSDFFWFLNVTSRIKVDRPVDKLHIPK